MQIEENQDYRNTILPNQKGVMNELFMGNDDALITAIYKTMIGIGNIKSPDELFIITRSPKFSIEEMASSPMMLTFLQSLIIMSKSKNILEIGAFVGVSAMYMASVLPEDGKMITLEKYDHFADIANENFKLNNLDKKIRLIKCDALEYLKKPNVENIFDFVFLDGNKEHYSDYFDLIDPMLSKNGLFIVDDIFFHGDSLNEFPSTEKGIGVKMFLEKVSHQKNYLKVVLPIRNGMILMLKIT